MSRNKQRFSVTLFLVALTIFISMGATYAGVVFNRSSANIRDFAVDAFPVIVIALAISGAFGFSPLVCTRFKAILGHFSEKLQLRIAQRVVSSKLRDQHTPMAIDGIRNLSGTVAFSFRPLDPNTVDIGVHLDVLVERSKERWGTVEVVSTEPNAYLATPYDRTNKDFFAHLEDRMNVDPSPPNGVILVPTVVPELEEFIHKLLGMEGEHVRR